MTSKRFDLAIVGNGSIAYFCAYYIAKSCPSLTIALLSESPRYFSGSAAAGAMVNVFAEIEDDLSTSKHEQNSFEIGLHSRSLWNRFFTENNLQDLITAESTYLYLQKNSSKYEQRNFSYACNAAKAAESLKYLNETEVKSFFESGSSQPEDACELLGECSFSAPLFLKSMEEILKSFSNIQFFDECTNIAEINSNNFELSLKNNSKLYSSKVICAAGFRTKALFSNISFLDVIQSVGTALELKNIDVSKLNRKVVRSVSRGGVQCGIHLVPRKDSIYIGAGSYIANSSKIPIPRTEEIRYLIDIAERDFLGKSAIYKSFVSPIIMGSRPRSIDSYPLIGTLKKHPSLFIATATNRVGLTWSPSIAQNALSWFTNVSNDKTINYDLVYGDWLPDRELIPFGTNKNCLQYYVETRASAEYEHGLIDNFNSKIELERIKSYGQILLEKVNKKIKILDGYSIHPDSWNVICNP